MSWDREKSEKRINLLKTTAPHAQIAVKAFDQFDLAERRRLIVEAAARDRSEDLIFNVKPNEAILVDGVHVYAQLIDYHEGVALHDRETESGHARLMSLLQLHYIACDRVAEEFEAQRVDYHGPRLHAVIITPTGNENRKERAQRALQFADALKRTIDRISAEAGQHMRSRVCIGLDSGRAVAVNSGRRSEPEPLFLGSPANYAAKLAEAKKEGIFPSDNVRRDAGLHVVTGGLLNERQNSVAGILDFVRMGATDARFSELASARAVDRIKESSVYGEVTKGGVFKFHRHDIPLKSIDFMKLLPSNSIRMELASIFADIDGFTKYVDACIQGNRIPEMVSNLHVIRGELAASLKEDFGGRKVRFIGDCLHGLLAEGTVQKTDMTDTVRSAVGAAAGLRSSFELCQQKLPNISNLGLAIGVELGATPISRLGIRGDRSVRCASSRAVSESERLQSDAGGTETAIGTEAMAEAPPSIQRIFRDGQTATNLDYDAYEEFMLAAPAVVSSGTVSRAAQPYSNKGRS